AGNGTLAGGFDLAAYASGAITRTGGRITANALTLMGASLGASAAGSHIFTAVASMTVSAATSAAYRTETDAVTLNSSSAGSVLDLTAGGAITVGGAISVGGGS